MIDGGPMGLINSLECLQPSVSGSISCGFLRYGRRAVGLAGTVGGIKIASTLT